VNHVAAMVALIAAGPKPLFRGILNLELVSIFSAIGYLFPNPFVRVEIIQTDSDIKH
jgi:hypothetical protein